jgi:hypothetical protein
MKRKELNTASLRKKMVRVFNEFIRLRDSGLACISCGVNGVDHAGHYFSTSQCPQPSMRFNEKNVNGQCVSCNTFNEGNRQGYEKGIIRKYGSKVIEELDVVRSLRQVSWNGFEFKVMIKVYQEKIKELKKSLD